MDPKSPPTQPARAEATAAESGRENPVASSRSASAIERALADERRLNAERLRAVQAHMKELAATIRDLRAGFHRVEAEKATLSRELEAREAEIVELRAAQRNVRSDTQTVHGDEAALTGRIETLEAELHQAERATEELRGESARHAQARREAEAKLVEAQQTVADLEMQTATQSAEIERLRLGLVEARETALAAAALIPATIDPDGAASHTAGPVEAVEVAPALPEPLSTAAREQAPEPAHEWWLEPGKVQRGRRSLMERAERVARGVASDATVDELRKLNLGADDEDEEFFTVGAPDSPEELEEQPAVATEADDRASVPSRSRPAPVADETDAEPEPARTLPAAAALLAARPAPDEEAVVRRPAPAAPVTPDPAPPAVEVSASEPEVASREPERKPEPTPTPRAPAFTHPDIPELSFETELESGALGPRYQARERDSRRPVTVQLLPGQFAEVDGKRVDSLLLARHSNLVAALSFGVCREGPYLVFERAVGETVAEWIGRVGPVQEHVALMVALQTARGLRQAAFHGAQHGDLTPAQVRISTTGEVKVEGVGLHELAPERSLPPTAGHAAPERLREGGRIDVPGDAYSFASLVYFMLTGRPPFEGDRETVLRAHATRGFPDVRDVRSDLSPGAIRLLERLTHADPDRRPVSWDQILVEVERLCPELEAAAEQEQPPRKGLIGRMVSDHPYLFAVAAGFPLLLAAAIVHLLL